jgi:hypothetical protein
MRFLITLLVAMFVAFPAFADVDDTVVCTSFVGLAATDDDQPLFIAPYGGAEVLRVGCLHDADLATPAQISFEDGGGTAVTHATLTCAENGAALTWIPATGANGLVAGEALVFDVDNSSTTGDTVVCAQVRAKF